MLTSANCYGRSHTSIPFARSPMDPNKQPTHPSCVSLQSLEEALKYCNYLFTFVFVVEAILKLVAFGFRRFFKDRLEMGWW